MHSPFRVKIAHIKKTTEFQEVLSGGKKWREKTVTLHSTVGGDRETIHIGTIVTKKLAPKAHQRNYIRRVIYGFFADNKQMLTGGSKNIVRLIRDIRGIEKRALSKTIREEVGKMARKAGITK